MTHEGRRPDQDLALKQNIEGYLEQNREWMGDAVEIYAGDHRRDHDPLELFREPTDPTRAEAPKPQLTPGQESTLREIAGRFGIGGEADVPSAADCQINEGGKPWKIEAEARINQGATTIIFAGSPHRSAENGTMGEDEIDYMRKRLPEGTPPARTEYDMVRQIAELQEGFKPLDEPEILPFGYDIQDGNAFVEEPTGHLAKIGEINGVPVWHLMIDGEPHFDEEQGKTFAKKRPDTAAVMNFISEVLSKEGDETSSVGFNTSTSYASRVVDTIRAGLDGGRTLSIGMYGRQRLADAKNIVKGAGEELEVAEQTDIVQIPGELHTMWRKLLELQAAVDKKWPEA